MTNQELEQMLEGICKNLGEHFDAVQIMATFHDDGTTKCLKRGFGNHYARIGMARELLNTDFQSDQAGYIAEKLDPPDQSEAWKK